MMGFTEELVALAGHDIRERLVEAAALLAEALRGRGIDPILVGGGAAQFHTAGSYVSGDIDFVAPGDPWPSLESLGFEKQGRHYVHRTVGLWVEFPSGQLDPEESAVTINVRGRMLRVLSAGDLLLDRLNAFKWGGSEADGVNSLLLLRLHPGIDSAEIRRRAAKEQILDALDALAAEMDNGEPPEVIVSNVRQRLEGR